MRGLTELTREGEAPVWEVEWPVMLKPFPDRSRHCSRHVLTCYVRAFRDRSMMLMIVLNSDDAARHTVVGWEPRPGRTTQYLRPLSAFARAGLH